MSQWRRDPVCSSSNFVIVWRLKIGIALIGFLTGGKSKLIWCHGFILTEGLVSQLGLVIGPLIGGVLTQYTTWRWCKSPSSLTWFIGLNSFDIRFLHQSPIRWLRCCIASICPRPRPNAQAPAHVSSPHTLSQTRSHWLCPLRSSRRPIAARSTIRWHYICLE